MSGPGDRSSARSAARGDHGLRQSRLGKAIVYDLETFPYFFVNTNGNRTADKDETKFPNRYKVWTPHLLKAAYDYQFVTKDPGACAHNPNYALELLYDSIADLGSKITVDLGAAKRP